MIANLHVCEGMVSGFSSADGAASEFESVSPWERKPLSLLACTFDSLRRRYDSFHFVTIDEWTSRILKCLALSVCRGVILVSQERFLQFRGISLFCAEISCMLLMKCSASVIPVFWYWCRFPHSRLADSVICARCHFAWVESWRLRS